GSPLEGGGSFQRADEGMQSAGLVMRRAEVQEAGVRLLGEPLLDSPRQPRLADARLTGQQHDLTFTTLRSLPSAQQQLNFFLAPDQRRKCSSVLCLEAARHGARAKDLPRLDGINEAP